jgi:hypothetical protein
MAVALPKLTSGNPGQLNVDSIANALQKSILGVISNLSSSLSSKVKDLTASGIESAGNFTKNLFNLGTGSEGEKSKKEKGLFDNPLYYKAYLFRGNRKYALQTILQNIEKKIGGGKESPADTAKSMLTPGSKKETDKSGGKSGTGKFGFFGDLSKALKPFVKIAFQAAKALLVFSSALLVGAFAFKMFSEDVNWGSVLLGVGILVGSALLLAKMSKGLMLASFAMIVLAGAMGLMGIALQTFSNLDWNTIGIAAASLAGLGLIMAGLGALSKFIILGAVALSVAGVALMVFGKAMEFVSVGLNAFMGFLERLQNAEWGKIIKSVGMFSLAIGIMGIAFAALGALIPLIFLGGIALTVMGGALWLFGKIIENVMPTLEKFFEVFVHPFIDLAKTFIQAVENIFTKIAEIFTSLVQQDPAHIREVFSALSWGLAKLSAALAAFGVGSAVGGVGAAIGSLFGSGNPLELIEKFAEKATQLEKTQIAMSGIAESLELFNENIEKVNPEKIMTLASSLDFLSAALWRMSTTSFAGAINSMFGGSDFDKIKELSGYGEGVKTLSDAINNLDFSKLNIEEIDTTELDMLTYSLARLRKVLDGFQTEGAFDFILNKIENVKRNVRSTIEQISGKTPTPSERTRTGPIEKSTFEIPESLGRVLNIRVSDISPDLKPIPVELKVRENFEDMTKELKMSSMEASQPIVIATNNNTVIAPNNSQVTNISQEGGEVPSRPMKVADSALLGINGNKNAFA